MHLRFLKIKEKHASGHFHVIARFQIKIVLFRFAFLKNLLSLQLETIFKEFMEKQKSIEALQFFATGLTEGALVHKLQGQIFKSQGFNKLGQKYIDHFNEEMEWVEKFYSRIIDLGGEVKFEGAKRRELCLDPAEYVKADLDIQKAGVDLLYKCIEQLPNDPTTYDIMKGYLADEEEDLYWSQGAMELIEKIGVQNWLITQL